MGIEEKRLEVLKKRISFMQKDFGSQMKKEVESCYYGRANFLKGKLEALDDVLTVLDMTYNQSSEDDLDAWLEFEYE